MSKNIFVLLLALFNVILVVSTNAQSGRKIKPSETPTPSVVEEQQAPNYSESEPQKPRRIYPPNWRTDKNKTSDNSRNGSGGKQTPSQPTATTQNGSSNKVEDDGDVLKIETNLVTIPVSVYDRNGLYIPSLRQADFKVFEDGKEQEIAVFNTTDKPFTVILLLDTSPSTEFQIEDIQNAARSFVDQLKPQDSVMVIEFDANIHVLTEPTSDRQQIYKAIKRADFGGGTSLYDAVQFSLQKRLSRIQGRKAIVLFTDGVDTTSTKSGYDSTVMEAEESETMVFPIYYNTFFDTRRSSGNGGGTISSPFPFPGSGGILSGRGNTPEEYALGKQYLEEIAAATGGRVFRPEATPGGLNAAFEGIAEELRRQYSIGYYPASEGKPGQRKQIKVRVNRPNLVVRSRDSYIVGSGANNQTTNAK